MLVPDRGDLSRSSSVSDVSDSGDLRRISDLSRSRGGEADVSVNIAPDDLGNSDLSRSYDDVRSGDVRGRRGDLRDGGGSDVSKDISMRRNIRLEIEGWNVKKRVYEI